MQIDYRGKARALYDAFHKDPNGIRIDPPDTRKAFTDLMNAVQSEIDYEERVEAHRNDPQTPIEPVTNPDHPAIFVNTKPPEQEPNVPRCHSSRDGDCYWAHCPQNVNYQSYCPYASAWEKHWAVTE